MVFVMTEQWTKAEAMEDARALIQQAAASGELDTAQLTILAGSAADTVGRVSGHEMTPKEERALIKSTGEP